MPTRWITALCSSDKTAENKKGGLRPPFLICCAANDDLALPTQPSDWSAAPGCQYDLVRTLATTSLIGLGVEQISGL